MDVYEGRTIPEGTIIFPNLTALSRDSVRYEKADEFLPERFLGDDLDASASALHPDHKKRDHFHYGFGRRLCQGIFVAEASLFIVVSRTLWGFDIKPLEGEPPLDMDAKLRKTDLFPNDFQSLTRKFTGGLVTKPKPFRVDIKSRGPIYEKTIRQSMADTKSDIPDFDSVSLVGH